MYAYGRNPVEKEKMMYKRESTMEEAVLGDGGRSPLKEEDIISILAG